MLAIADRLGGEVLSQMVPRWPLCLHWHIAGDEIVEHVSGLYSFRSVREFRRDVEFLVRAFSPIGLDEVIEGLRSGEGVKAGSVLLTFDDGFRECKEIIAPVLEGLGVRGCFFVISSCVGNDRMGYPQKKSLILRALARESRASVLDAAEKVLRDAGAWNGSVEGSIRKVFLKKAMLLDIVGPLLEIDFDAYLRRVRPYMEVEDLRLLLSRGFSVGAHSVLHPLFKELSLEEQVREVLDSVESLNALLGRKCDAFAFPYTDDGICEGLFEEILQPSGVEVTFGIGGLHRRIHPRHLARISMERSSASAFRIVGWQGLRCLAQRWGIW